MDFQIKDVFFCPLLKGEITIAEHSQTGTPWIHLRDRSGINFTGLSVRTPSFDHSGIAHACEHLVGAGSKSHSENHPFLSALNHPNTLFLNNFTLPDHTIYCLLQKGGRPDVELLNIFLDGILNPLLRPENFASEIVSETGQSGALLNEMRMKSTDPRQVRQMHLLSQLFPGSSFSYDFAGRPNIVERLTLGDVVRFHTDHYQLQNMLLLTSGEGDGSRFIDTLSDLARNALAPAPLSKLPSSPPQPTRLSNTVATSLWPVDAGPELTMAYAIDLSSGATQAADLAVFETVFLRGPQSPIRAMLAGLDGFGGVRNPFGVMREIYWPILAISAKANVSERTARAFEAEFAEALGSYAHAPLVAVGARRAQLDLSLDVDPSNTNRALTLFRRAAQTHAVGKDGTDAIRLAHQQTRLDHIRQSPDVFLSEVGEWFGPNRTGTICLAGIKPDAKPSHPATIANQFSDPLAAASFPDRPESCEIPVRSVITRSAADSPCRVQIGFKNAQMTAADALWITIANKSLAALSGSTDLRQASYLLHRGLAADIAVFAESDCDPTLWSAWNWHVLPDDLSPSLAIFSKQLTGLISSGGRALASATRRAVQSLHRQRTTAPLALLQSRSRAGVSPSGALTDAITGFTALPALEALTQQLLSGDLDATVAQAQSTFARVFSRQSLCVMTEASAPKQTETERALQNFAVNLSETPLSEKLHVQTALNLSSHALMQAQSHTSYVAMSYALPKQYATLATALQLRLVTDIRASGHVYDAKATYCRKSQTVTISTVGDSRPEQSLQMLRAALTDELVGQAHTVSAPFDQPDLTERLRKSFTEATDADCSDNTALAAHVNEMRKTLPSIAYSAAFPNMALTEIYGTSPDVLGSRP